MAGAWFILRTSGKSTIALAAALADEGHTVWTPVEHRSLRLPRSKRREQVALPLLPSFVFAGIESLPALLALSHSPALSYRVWDKELRKMVVKGRPYFSVFRHGGDVPTVSEASLASLRAAERRTAPKIVARVFVPGEVVKLTEGGFAGLTGTIEAVKGKFTTVRFPGFAEPVKIATWLLDGSPVVSVSGETPDNGLAALAA